MSPPSHRLIPTLLCPSAPCSQALAGLPSLPATVFIQFLHSEHVPPHRALIPTDP